MYYKDLIELLELKCKVEKETEFGKVYKYKEIFYLDTGGTAMPLTGEEDCNTLEEDLSFTKKRISNWGEWVVVFEEYQPADNILRIAKIAKALSYVNRKYFFEFLSTPFFDGISLDDFQYMINVMVGDDNDVPDNPSSSEGQIYKVIDRKSSEEKAKIARIFKGNLKGKEPGKRTIPKSKLLQEE